MVEPKRPQTTTKRGAGILFAGYLRLQRHTQNMKFLTLFHCNNGYTNTPPYYVKFTLPVLLDINL